MALQRLRKSVVLALAAIAFAVALVVLLVGPWPAYSSRGPTLRKLAAAGERIKVAPFSPSLPASTHRPLRAGWASRVITPFAPVPLFGYAARQGHNSTGVMQDLRVRAVAVGDGVKTVLLIGADLLVIPPNLSNPVRAQIRAATGLDEAAILFSATHTHSAPNPWDNLAARHFAGGAYVEEVGQILRTAFVEAALTAIEDMEPAGIARGRFDAAEFVRNRAREGNSVDSRFEYLVFRKADGKRCYVLNFSAHATVLGPDNLLISGDYPGYLQGYLEQTWGVTALFQCGASGNAAPEPPVPAEAHLELVRTAMGRIPDGSPARTVLLQAPEALEVHARAAALGQALAERVQKGDAGLVFADLAPISYLGTRVPLPPYQIRFRLGWRFSPLLLPLLGVDSTGWIQAVRIGDTVLIGLPVEPSSELGKTWKDSFTSKDLSLWFCSFSSDYRGYVSPDIYYRAVAPDGSLPYETGLMSWCGPDAAQYFGTITRWLVRLMAPEAVLPDIPESPGLPPAPNRPATPPDTP
ncbi:MAG: hypothetical protein A3K19_13890 [Lentisphaerae bacterium RIFOXYB12_FULL_65_16]|nr:MAG: hypothetical protein A3K18_18055 [Lentisphaerae bacterium RIFOXYA12_64_32]OGV94127.1 MAG: hypothetical protein A3K19_13890 [Lentisphaerae bacterium RIFOXYB12_FULL_65_16]